MSGVSRRAYDKDENALLLPDGEGTKQGQQYQQHTNGEHAAENSHRGYHSLVPRNSRHGNEDDPDNLRKTNQCDARTRGSHQLTK